MQLTDEQKIYLAAGLVTAVALLMPSCKVTAQQEQFIALMHPSVRQRFRCFVLDLTRAGWEVRIASAWRGWPDSLRIWQTNPQVQACCQPGQDYHFFGLAMDVTLHKPGQVLNMASPRSAWIASGVGQIAKKHQLRWGISFNGYYDPVHFDYPVHRMSDLVAAHAVQFGALSQNKGNKLSFAGLPITGNMQDISNRSIPTV